MPVFSKAWGTVSLNLLPQFRLDSLAVISARSASLQLVELWSLFELESSGVAWCNTLYTSSLLTVVMRLRL